MLLELGIIVPKPIKILSDNMGATFISKNPIGHCKLKHVMIDLQFVRERTEKSQWNTSRRKNNGLTV